MYVSLALEHLLLDLYGGHTHTHTTRARAHTHTRYTRAGSRDLMCYSQAKEGQGIIHKSEGALKKNEIKPDRTLAYTYQ